MSNTQIYAVCYRFSWYQRCLYSVPVRCTENELTVQYGLNQNHKYDNPFKFTGDAILVVQSSRVANLIPLDVPILDVVGCAYYNIGWFKGLFYQRFPNLTTSKRIPLQVVGQHVFLRTQRGTIEIVHHKLAAFIDQVRLLAPVTVDVYGMFDTTTQQFNLSLQRITGEL